MSLSKEPKKSRRSGAGGNCVTVARPESDRIVVTDSKTPDGPALTFTADEWDAFIGGAKDGEFDL